MHEAGRGEDPEKAEEEKEVGEEPKQMSQPGLVCSCLVVTHSVGDARVVGEGAKVPGAGHHTAPDGPVPSATLLAPNEVLYECPVTRSEGPSLLDS